MSETKANLDNFNVLNHTSLIFNDMRLLMSEETMYECIVIGTFINVNIYIINQKHLLD